MRFSRVIGRESGQAQAPPAGAFTARCRAARRACGGSAGTARGRRRGPEAISWRAASIIRRASSSSVRSFSASPSSAAYTASRSAPGAFSAKSLRPAMPRAARPATKSFLTSARLMFLAGDVITRFNRLRPVHWDDTAVARWLEPLVRAERASSPRSSASGGARSRSTWTDGTPRRRAGAPRGRRLGALALRPRRAARLRGRRGGGVGARGRPRAADAVGARASADPRVRALRSAAGRGADADDEAPAGPTSSAGPGV